MYDIRIFVSPAPVQMQEAGCNTSQELEFDYVGIIIGDDMRYENGRIVTDFTKWAKTDQHLSAYLKL